MSHFEFSWIASKRIARKLSEPTELSYIIFEHFNLEIRKQHKILFKMSTHMPMIWGKIFSASTRGRTVGGKPCRPLRRTDPLQERATPETKHTYLVQETNVDHQGRSPRLRPFHCTPVGLTSAIAPNVGDSGTLFLSVGSCVRARPRQKQKPNNRPLS